MLRTPIKNLMTISGTLAIVTSMMTNLANAEFTQVEPITKTFEVEDRTTSITIYPEFAVSGDEGVVNVDLQGTVDATDLQDALKNLLEKRWKHEECGDRFRTKAVNIRPAGNGALNVGLTAQAQRWECIKTKVPHTLFDWETKTITKNKLISQSIRVEAQVTPVINDHTVSAEATITKAMPSGLAKHLVKAFDLHGKVKDRVQERVDDELQGNTFQLPDELKVYDVAINHMTFVDIGSGRLGLDFEANGSITQSQLRELINEEVRRRN